MSVSTSQRHPYARKLNDLNQPFLNAPDIPNTPTAVAQINEVDLARELSPFELSQLEQPSIGFVKESQSDNSSINIGQKRDGNKSKFGSVSSTISFEEHIKPPSLGKSTTSLSSGSSTSKQNNRRVRSVDLSHLYLADGSKDTQFTFTNESVAGISHRKISQYLGEESTVSLVPRLKTIEMYRENVKKSKDPDVLFEYAQYILQTALSMEESGTEKHETLHDEADISSHLELRNQFLKEALHYLKKLSLKGYKEAQYLLADSYSSGAFGKVNAKEAFTFFQSSAKHGHVEAAYRTAICFEEGLGTTRDSRKCIEFLKFAASRNHPAAMFKLGVYAFYGRMSMPSDLNTKKNGIKWLSRAVAKANPLICAAPYELAKIYEKGFLDIVIADMKYAIELYVQAASLGHIPSATLLGKIYEVGNEVVPQDVALSVNYYTIAAERGDPEAMLALCAWYLVGAEPVFEIDEKEAFEWALKAAKHGFPKAQFSVGYFLEKGKGCSVDLDEAYKWYQIAADNNDSRAINKLKPQGHSKSHSKSMNIFNYNFLKDNFEKTKHSSNSSNASDKITLPRTVLQEQQTPQPGQHTTESFLSPITKHPESSPAVSNENRDNFYSTDAVAVTPPLVPSEFKSAIHGSPQTPNLRPASGTQQFQSNATKIPRDDPSTNKLKKNKKKRSKSNCIIL